MRRSQHRLRLFFTVEKARNIVQVSCNQSSPVQRQYKRARKPNSISSYQ